MTYTCDKQPGRTLSTGRHIPLVGYGTGMTADLTRNIELALRAGYRQFDSGFCYGTFEEVGKALLSSTSVPRHEQYIVSKYFDYEAGESVESVVEKVTKVIHTMLPCPDPYLDLLLLHQPTPGPEGRNILWKAFAILQDNGLVKDIGISNFGIHQIASLPAPKPAITQIEVHPWCQQRELVNYCENNGILIQAYAATARNQYSNEQVVRDIAEELGKDATQVLLRWSLQKGYVPITRSSTPSRIKSNLELFNFELSEDQMARLTALGNGKDKYLGRSYNFQFEP